MRSTLIYYEIVEFEVPDTADSPPSKWFGLDALQNHDFPLERLAGTMGSRYINHVNWPQTFSRKGLNYADYRRTVGTDQPGEHTFFRRDDSKSSIPPRVCFKQRGNDTDVLQGDLLTYREIESGLHLFPLKVVRNGIKLKFAQALAKKTSIPRAWLAEVDELSMLSDNLTDKHASDWSAVVKGSGRLDRHWAYLSYRL